MGESNKVIKSGQAALEYIVLIGVVAAAIIAILVYIGRGFQGNIRNQAGQIGSGQYEPNMTVSNTETKQVTSTLTSTSNATVSYAGKKEAEIIQNKIQNNIAAQRKILRQLTKYNEEMDEAIWADANSQTNWFLDSILSLAADIGRVILPGFGYAGWQASKVLDILSGACGGSSSGDIGSSSTAMIRQQIQTVTNSRDALQKQLDDARKTQEQYPNYQDVIGMLEAQIATKDQQLYELNEQLKLLVLQAKLEDLPVGSEDRALRDELAPDNDPEKIQSQIDQLAEAQKTRSEDLENSYKGTAPEGNTPDIASEANFGELVSAIINIQPPPEINVNKSVRSIEEIQVDIDRENNDLASLQLNYQNLLNQLDDLTSQYRTTSIDTNTEKGKIIIHKSTYEVLGNL